MHQRIMSCRPITRHLMRYAASCGMIDQQVCDRGAGIAKTFPHYGKLIDMCTLVILRRPEHPWPVVIAANRDEMIDREWRAPPPPLPDRAGGGGAAGRPSAAGGLCVRGEWSRRRAPHTRPRPR